ncbi:membrane dipeptidase [Natronospira proteinivora]|uniref:Membrane dipeptidase n=1 Tax=Natronospira proteinivora TaxID=1807133 RepID=A0ABT1G8Q8_9GAMM|nr:dipeptidase [Natronospira proteinivora]MCP1727706.1 membrane dipeptidase [Natronospira proteinivora]
MRRIHWCVLSLLLLIAAPVLALQPEEGEPPQEAETVENETEETEELTDRERAIRILESVPLIDGHNDVPWQYRQRVDNRLAEIDLAEDTTELDPPMHTDLNRLREGRVGGQFWSVYVSPSLEGAEATKAQLEQIDIARRLIASHADLSYVTTADELEEAFEEGHIASLLGMEGGHVLDNSLATLRTFYALGARYMTLTHWQNTDWADAATDDPEHGGLTGFGQAVIEEMNRIGMLVDLSHVAPSTMHDVLDVTETPVIFSHSSAMGVTPHPRNVPDDVLDRLPENGGIVMVTFVPSFVSEAVRQHGANRAAEQARLESLHIGDPEAVEAGMEAWDEDNPTPGATLSDVADHIDYIRDRIGVEYIGIGGDYDGITTVPEGLEDVSTYPDLFAELIRRGYEREELEKIAGQNLLRVFRANEAYKESEQGTTRPLDVRIDDFE